MRKNVGSHSNRLLVVDEEIFLCEVSSIHIDRWSVHKERKHNIHIGRLMRKNSSGWEYIHLGYSVHWNERNWSTRRRWNYQSRRKSFPYRRSTRDRPMNLFFLQKSKKMKEEWEDSPMNFIQTSLINVTFTKQLSMTLIQFDWQGNCCRPEHRLQKDNCM